MQIAEFCVKQKLVWQYKTPKTTALSHTSARKGVERAKPCSNMLPQAKFIFVFCLRFFVFFVCLRLGLGYYIFRSFTDLNTTQYRTAWTIDYVFAPLHVFSQRDHDFLKHTLCCTFFYFFLAFFLETVVGNSARKLQLFFAISTAFPYAILSSLLQEILWFLVSKEIDSKSILGEQWITIVFDLCNSVDLR